MRKLLLLLALLPVWALGADNFNTLDQALFPTTYGTATYCWTSNGAGVVPSWQACSGGGGGSGTVTTVSVVTANGFAGTVATATTTPAITLTTSVSGLLLGNGTAAAAYGGTTCTNQFPRSLNASGAATCATVNLASDTTGALPAGSMPALTGDVTSSAGTVATTLANIPTATPAVGTILHTNIAAPSSPASGKVSVYSDSTDLRLHDKNAAGAIGTTVVADTGASNNFLTAISAAGVISKAQPTPTNVGLGSVTNDAQTKASIVPNTAPSAGQILVGNAGGTAYAPVSASSDVTIASTGAVTIAANAVTYAKQATQATNTVSGNATSGTAVPTALAMTSCSTAASAVKWTTNTGFGCNTAIDAATIAGSTLPSMSTLNLGGIIYVSSTASQGNLNNIAITGLVLGNGTSAPSAYAGSTITAGQLPTAISAAGALTGTATPTLGASGTLGSLTMGNATSGTLTLQPAAGAITGTVLIPSGADTLVNLTGTQSLSNKTLTSPVIATGLTASGSSANTFAGSSGTFITSTGANTLSGAVTIGDATTPSLTTASGKTNTGFVQINGKTSGALKLIAADAAAQTVTVSLAAQTSGAATVTLPDMAGTNDTLVFLAKAQTLTTKRITKRVSTTTSSATPTINTDTTDTFGLTAQAADITSFTTNLSGTPTDGQVLWIYIVGTAARAITWGTSFEASTVALPTTTVTTNRLDVGFVWNAATSKWRCVATS